MKKHRITLLIGLILVVGGIIVYNFSLPNNRPSILSKIPIPARKPPAPTIPSSPTPSPTPKPLTFDELNKLYGPCVHLPVIFYHHIQDLNEAEQQGHKSLAVDPKIFQTQMQYLISKGYNTVSISDLTNFFDGGVGLPARPVMITFDDGYNDFETNAMPVIRQYNLKTVMFLPTGLVGNPGYLTWDQVSSESSSGLVYFANHSWSHASLAVSLAGATKEIDTAQTQLTEHNLNLGMALAYPYGTYKDFTVGLLAQRGYKLAFGIVYGATQCKAQRLVLPRIRIGNASLSAYGF